MNVEKLKQFSAINDDDGFTLMEIVIAVGLMMILSSVGIMTYSGIDDYTKKTAAQNAAKTVYNAAASKQVDGNANSHPEDAAIEYNSSQKPNRKGNIPIETTVTELPNGRLRVMAFYDGGEEYAVYETGSDDAEGGSTGGGTGDSGEIPAVPIIEDTITQLTYRCNSTVSNHHLPIYNLDNGTRVSMLGSDGTSKLVKYVKPNLRSLESNYGSLDFTRNLGWSDVSEPLTMKAGITYTVKVYGKFTNFSGINTYTADNTTGADKSFKDCLVSVDRLGKHSGIKTMNWIGGRNLVSVPESVPSTVHDMRAIFYRAFYLNDSNLSKWDPKISGDALIYAFTSADHLNQDLSKWDTSNITSLSATFYSADRFNNGGKPLNWNTSKVTSLSSTFRYALAFNQNVDTRYDSKTGETYWDITRVTNMARTFHDARAFNNGKAAGVSAPMKWDTTNATNMAYMFYNAESFNGNLRRTTVSYGGYESWNTNKVTNMSYMFSGAKSFNASITNWWTSSLRTMDYMFQGAVKFNSGIKTSSTYWNVSKVTNMEGVFKNATAFNQDISSWNVASVTNHKDFATGARFQNTTNYHPNW